MEILCNITPTPSACRSSARQITHHHFAKKKPRPINVSRRPTTFRHIPCAAGAGTTTEDLVDTSEYPEGQSDYYSILGVEPTATPLDIKRSYRRLMKDWHPDQSNDEDTNEFAIFLNLVYETLMDDDSRAEYDVIQGFSFAGKNPFADKSYPAEFAFVDEFSCIGCRNCNSVCPKTFEMEEEFGRARVMRQNVDIPEKIQESIDTCPVSCIHWVSAPQLTLLEETMGRMERVDAWILLQGGGKGANLNVFGEASILWEKRQAAQRDREQQARWAWAPFRGAAGANMQEAARRAATESANTSGGGGGGPGERSADGEEFYSGKGARPGKRVNVAEMAAAARKWRDFQRTKRRKKEVLLLGDVNGTTK